MVCRHVEGFEIIIVPFYLRPFHYLKTHAAKNVTNLLEYLSCWMETAQGNLLTG
jgi:hypothetical protein